MDDIYVYLYQVQNLIGEHHDLTCYQYYYVAPELLYNDNGYLPSIEVGEYMGNLETLDQISALDVFLTKVKEEIEGKKENDNNEL